VSRPPFDAAYAGPESALPQRYPAFDNEGTRQPKFDARLDYDLDGRSRWTVEGGFSGTDGILHSGIGPFDIQHGTNMSYGRAEYRRGPDQDTRGHTVKHHARPRKEGCPPRPQR
jgi:hypothetical protein